MKMIRSLAGYLNPAHVVSLYVEATGAGAPGWLIKALVGDDREIIVGRSETEAEAREALDRLVAELRTDHIAERLRRIDDSLSVLADRA